jgi:hypothetical protein
MQSKLFGFFIIILILGMITVGWYFVETYQKEVPAASAKGFEYPGQESVSLRPKEKDFLSWIQEKISIASNFIREDQKSR